MKVSINLAQFYSNVDLASIDHDVLLERVGSQLGAVEESIEFTPKYKDVVVARVVNVRDHPNADRLHVCLVDDGGVVKNVERDQDGLVQVVCGAPNVRDGIYVAWLAPGVTVPSSLNDDEPFVLSARELRGVLSNGMLASPKELDINDDHDGILEINPDEVGKEPKAGEPLTNYYGLDDFVIDCENKMFTHRPDCFGNLGVARELAGISGLKFKSPDWYLTEPRFEKNNSIKLNIINDVKKLVPRFMAVAVDNIHVHKSPIWMQASLARVGIKSINNVVDVTNYIMHLTGQPMHAFDYDKLAKLNSSTVSLGPRLAKKGEKLTVLGGKNIELDDNDLVIVSGDKAVALAGVIGGAETEVDEHTTKIVIECATFDMFNIRRSSMRHGLFTDASTRYTKGQSPLQNDRVLAYALKLFSEHANGKQASAVYDVHANLDQPSDVSVTADFINKRLGTDLSTKEITEILERVEFEILNVPANKNVIHVRPPFWRTDIEIAEDVVEEVGRIYGFSKLPLALPSRPAKAGEQGWITKLSHETRQTLASLGANEALTYSFVDGKLIQNAGQNVERAYHLRNALSPDLQHYRLSLSPSLLDKVAMNIRSDRIRNDDNEFAIFEIGKAHNRDYVNEKHYSHEAGVPEEMMNLCLVVSADDKTAARKYNGSAYYLAKHFLRALTQNLSIKIKFAPYDNHLLAGNAWLEEVAKPFEPNRSALVVDNEGNVWGVVGEFNSKIKKALKLPDFTAGFEIDLMLLKEKYETYEQLSQYPKIQQDITLEVKGDVLFGDVFIELETALMESAGAKSVDIKLIEKDIFKSEEAETKRFTFRVWLISNSRTMTIEESNKIIDDAINKVSGTCDAVRI